MTPKQINRINELLSLLKRIKEAEGSCEDGGELSVSSFNRVHRTFSSPIPVDKKDLMALIHKTRNDTISELGKLGVTVNWSDITPF